MSNGAIKAEHIYKKFRRGERHGSLRDAIASWIRLSPNGSGNQTLQKAEFWAVQDVSFEVASGQAFGIIGPNGAGKSTVLKLLAGIMRPNRGSLSIRGRVSALIEVGAGFHPDLTGRENIYLNASILGMPRAEVRRAFDEIVDFAGIREFLDTPIKRYSSGMYARLGFAVAVHADPQVLLVDEVLSVGDRVFRAKCMDKMRAFLKRGIAVVFVSHDLRAVSSFCDMAMVLAAGRVLHVGDAGSAVAHYHKACFDRWMLPEARQRSLVTVGPVRLLNAQGQPATTFSPGEEIQIEFNVRFDVEMPHPSFGLSLMRAEDHMILFETSSTRMRRETLPAVRGSHHRVRYRVRLNVPPGEYCVGYHVRDRDATLYAATREDETRLMVVGNTTACGGMVYLAPRVEVDDLSKLFSRVGAST